MELNLLCISVVFCPEAYFPNIAVILSFSSLFVNTIWKIMVSCKMREKNGQISISINPNNKAK